MIRTPVSARGSAGFTLLETLVVVVIVALVAAIAWPRISTPSPSLLVRTTALRLAADLRSARADAMRTGATQTVTVDPARRMVWQNEDGRPRRLARAVRISVSGATGTGIVTFRPDGGSSGGDFVLAAGSQRTSVSVDWMTGTVSVGRRP